MTENSRLFRGFCNFASIPLKGRNAYKLKNKRFMKRLWIFAIAVMTGVKGKTLTVATTTGSEYDAYRSGGKNMYTMDVARRQ